MMPRGNLDAPHHVADLWPVAMRYDQLMASEQQISQGPNCRARWSHIVAECFLPVLVG